MEWGMMGYKFWIRISGALWFVLGSFLVYKGAGYLIAAEAFFIGCIALLIGAMKGRYILSKTANRLIQHLRSLQEPISFKEAYPKRYYAVLFIMMGMGRGLNLMALPLWVRGGIDVMVGLALFVGSWTYFTYREV